MSFLGKSYFFIAISLLCLLSCSKEEISLTSKTEILCDAHCQYQLISFETTQKWEVSHHPDWITLKEKTGKGSSELSLYIQQNDEDIQRDGYIIIQTKSGQSIKIFVVQQLPDENGTSSQFTKNFGLGWGYDIKEDIADVSAIRGQIFDSQALANDYGEDDVIMIENNTVVKSQYATGFSHEELESQISSKITGSVDLKVASGTVSAQYSEQIKEQKDRMYIWWRDMRAVKKTYFSNAIDLFEPETVAWCTTSSFRKACRNSSAEDIIRRYGTHLITASDLGGKFDYYFTISTVIKEKVEQVVTTISVKVFGFKKSSSHVDEKVWTDIKSDFKGNFFVEGGGKYGDLLNKALSECITKGVPISDQSVFDNWFNCFADASNAQESHLTMIDFRVVPIWEIVGVLNPQKGEEVERYIKDTYLK